MDFLNSSYHWYDQMIDKQKIHIILLSGLYLLIPGIIAWVTGRPFIFPSLGPTAYVLAFDTVPERTYNSRTIIGGHACGIIGGLLSYYLLVSPNHLSGTMEPFAQASLVLLVGAATALMITILLMLLGNASHPPACATTLIISLGILPGVIDGIVILAAVTFMYLGYRTVQHKIIK